MRSLQFQAAVNRIKCLPRSEASRTGAQIAKQRTIFTKIIQRVKRDAGSVWSSEFIDSFTAGAASKPIPEDALAMLGDGFLPTMQYEEYVSTIIRAVCDELGNGSDPLIYPGLMAAWESAPATVEFDGGASGFVNGGGLDIESVPLDGLEDIFPACLLFDIRPFGLSPYDLGAFEGLFVYPSYDLDRGYAVLLLMAVGLKKGLSFPLTSKIVVSGETFADALEASDAERRILERRCLSGLDSGLHDGLFSALDDEPEVCALAVRLLAAMCGNRSEVERTRTKKGLRLRVTLAADEDGDLGVSDASPADEGLEAGGAVSPSGEAEESSRTSGSSGVPDGIDEGALIELEAGDSPADAPLASEVDAEGLLAQIALLKRTVEECERKSASLEYHLKQSQTAAAQAKADADALRARATIVEGMDIPATPIESLLLAERAFADRLVFLDQARRSAADFAKGSAREVWAVLRSVAVILHPLVFGDAGGSVIHAYESQSGFELTFREMKHIKQSDAYGKYRSVAYEGQQKDISAHVKGKGSKKGESLRVHFFADYRLRKIVIAHCGEHLPTYDTPTL